MSLQVLVNGFDIANGITHRINWVETTGLFDPAALVDPEAVDTFEGPYRVRQTTTDYGLREVSISGILVVAASDYASKLRALDGLQAIYAARPSRVVVGTLELSVDFGRVQVAADQLKRLNGMIKYTVTGTAIPATFACVYGNGTGLVQGIPVDTQRVNEAAILATMATGVGTVTNPGDVPTPAVLTIQGAASTVYYLATSATGRRVPISTDANGVGRIDERAGLYLSPGINRITAYSAATGTATLTTITVMSFFGTTWRYSGNAVAGNATRFDLGPALTVNRTGSARFFRGNTNPALNGTDGIFTAGDDEPRIGWVWQNRRNLIVNSINLQSASWTSTLASRTQGGALEPFGYSDNSLSVLTASDTGTGSVQNNQYSLGSLSAISYVASVYILKDSNTTRRSGIVIGTTGGTAYAMINTSTGVALLANNSTGTMTSAVVSRTDEGLWWRLSIRWTGESINDFRLAPAIGPTTGNDAANTSTGTAVFACPQVEIGTTPTAYQATDASGISLDHPVNDSGLVLEGNATNLCLRSQDQNNATWVKTGVTSITTTNTAPDGSATAFEGTSNAANSFCTQTISGLTNGSTYTFSVWLRTPSGTNTVNIYLSDGGSPVFTACTVTTNWSRFSVTRTIAATIVDVVVGEGSTWSTGEVVQIWGAQLELGTAATSYIPTTTTSASRLADVAGLVSPHNLLTYSDQFDNAAWVKDARVTVTSNVETGPDGISNADRVVVSTAAGGDNIRLAVPTNTYDVGKVYTLSCWVKTITGTPTMRMFLNNAGPTPTTFTPTTSWQRFSATVIPTSAASDGFTIDFNNVATGTGYTIALYGAQLTEGYLPGRYVRTTDTQVLPVSMIDPSWSQNGYIEADFLWSVMSQPPVAQTCILGNALSTPAGTRNINNITGASGRFAGVINSPDTTGRQITFDDLTLYNSGYARLRLEWTNYLLNGSRFMFLRLYANGVLRAETNFAGTAGSSWAAAIPSIFYLGRSTQRGEQTTISNLVIGTPSLPDGAIVAGI